MVLSSLILVILLVCSSTGSDTRLLHFSDLRFPLPEAASSPAARGKSGILLRFRDLRAHDASIAGRGEAQRIAVLPFHGVAAAPEHRWLSRELADSLITRLSPISRFEFIDRDVMRPHERKVRRGRSGGVSRHQIGRLAREIGADIVVVGRYAVTGKKLKIDIQTMRPSDSALSRVISVSGPADRVWETEGKTAGRMADLLGITLGDRERERLSESPTHSPAAFREYRKGLQSPEGTHRKIEHLQKAVEADPEFARAHYQLGNAYREIGTTYQYVEWFNKALDSYRRAVAIDPRMAEAYSAMGLVYMLNGRYELTRKALTRAIRLDPELSSARRYLRRLDSMGK